MHSSGNIYLKDKEESLYLTQQKEKSTGGPDTFWNMNPQIVND